MPLKTVIFKISVLSVLSVVIQKTVVGCPSPVTPRVLSPVSTVSASCAWDLMTSILARTHKKRKNRIACTFRVSLSVCILKMEFHLFLTCIHYSCNLDCCRTWKGVCNKKQWTRLFSFLNLFKKRRIKLVEPILVNLVPRSFRFMRKPKRMAVEKARGLPFTYKTDAVEPRKLEHG